MKGLVLMSIEIFLRLKVALPERRTPSSGAVLASCHVPVARGQITELQLRSGTNRVSVFWSCKQPPGGPASRKPSNWDQTGLAGGNLRQRHLPELPHKQTLNERLQVLQGPRGVVPTLGLCWLGSTHSPVSRKKSLLTFSVFFRIMKRAFLVVGR